MLQRLIIICALILSASTVTADDPQTSIQKLHILIPGAAGGGWDRTARGTGEALSRSGLVDRVTFENMSGGGGSKAIAHLIELNRDTTIMVNSTPIVVRALRGIFPQSYRDLAPIASLIGDYSVIAVRAESPITTIAEFHTEFAHNPSAVAIAGGSVYGGTDHIVAAMLAQGLGVDPGQLKYIPYDAGGKAMAALLSGEIKALSTGFSEAITMAKAGEVRIIAVTSPERVDAYKDAPTLKEQGYDAVFVNWRGFFAAPGLPTAKADQFRKALADMYNTPEWEAVRARNGWVNIFNPGSEFVDFLENQEKEIKNMMVKLGFL